MTLKERMDEHWRSTKMYSAVHFNVFVPLKSQTDRRGRPCGPVTDYMVLKGRVGRRSTHQKNH